LPAEPDAFVAICPSRAVLARIGEKWTLMLLIALGDGPLRFAALQRRLDGISQKMLTQTLRSLERDGLVSRHVVSDKPLRVAYSLTELGRDLLPLAGRIKDWAEDHLHEIAANNRRFDRARRRIRSYGNAPDV
jgi:DNA-binding HxlR family transcriptional regulator